MRDMGNGQQVGRWVGRRVTLCCTLVLLLLAAHAALMASVQHVAVMGPLMGAVSLPGITEPPGDTGATHRDADGGKGAPAAPHPVLGDCPAQQAVLPLLLVLLALGSLVALRTTATRDTGHLLSWHLCFSLPPPLAPARRRALLQVFLN
jgi:hypothetical protein